MNRVLAFWLRIGTVALAACAWLAVGSGSVSAADTLDIYFVDAGKAFGANATILVSPSGESAMLDAGLPNQAPNVLAVFKQAGVKQLFDDSRGAYWFGLSAAPKAEVHALRPRVAILSLGSNGHPRGNAKALETVLSSPGFEDLWQTDLVREGGEKDHNARESFIANLTDAPRPELQFIKLSASPDGSFTVTNSRTGFTKRYPPRGQP